MHREYSGPDTYPFKFPPALNVILKDKWTDNLLKSIRGEQRSQANTLNPASLEFNSKFESGNLDLVAKGATRANEYDLYMRVDANTRGHHQWFYFSVKNYDKKRVKFNIVNFTKNNSLYTQGMRVNIWSERQNEDPTIRAINRGWQKGGENI